MSEMLPRPLSVFSLSWKSCPKFNQTACFHDPLDLSRAVFEKGEVKMWRDETFVFHIQVHQPDLSQPGQLAASDICER